MLLLMMLFCSQEASPLVFKYSLSGYLRILDDRPEYACTASHQQIDKPASDIRKPQTVHKVIQALVGSQERQRSPNRDPHLSR